MQKKEIINLANEIYKKFNTADPFKIIENIDCSVIYKDMPKKIRGFTLKNFRINLIYINTCLNEIEMRNTLLHELGHIFCGHDGNRIFTSLKTHFVTAKLENEADLFYVAILMNLLEKEEIEGYSLEQISNRLGIEKDKLQLYF